MTNEITLNIEELLNVPDNSITDYETIRQIGLLSYTKHNIPKEVQYRLNKKVKEEFSFVGLYPNVLTVFDINSEEF